MAAWPFLASPQIFHSRVSRIARMTRRVVSESSTTRIRRSIGVSQNYVIAPNGRCRNTRIRVNPEFRAVRWAQSQRTGSGKFTQVLSRQNFPAEVFRWPRLPTLAFGPIYIDYCRWRLRALWYEFLFDESDAKSMCVAMLRAHFSSSFRLRVQVRYRPVEPGAANLAAPPALHGGEKNEANRAQQNKHSHNSRAKTEREE